MVLEEVSGVLGACGTAGVSGESEIDVGRMGWKVAVAACIGGFGDGGCTRVVEFCVVLLLPVVFVRQGDGGEIQVWKMMMIMHWW